MAPLKASPRAYLRGTEEPGEALSGPGCRRSPSRRGKSSVACPMAPLLHQDPLQSLRERSRHPSPL